MSDKVETMTSDLTPFNDDEISDVKKVASIDATSVKTSSLLSQTAIRQIFNSPHQSTTTNSNAATDCERPTDMQMPFSTQLLRMVTALHEDGDLQCKLANISEPQGDKRSKKRKRKKIKHEKPNYFISLRLHNQNIRQQLTHIQKELIAKDERLKLAAVSPAKIHITLFVMALNSDEQIALADTTLKSLTTELQEFIAQRNEFSSLTVEGVSNFNQGVIFAQVKDDEALETLTAIRTKVYDAFVEKKLTNYDSKPFKPHVTILKLSRNQKKLKHLGISKLNPLLYETWKDYHFGIEPMQGLQLCSMLLPPEMDGFYQCKTTINFNHHLES